MVSKKCTREEFIENNLGLVHSICKRFIGKGIEYDDLFQAGCMGLVKATDAFDETKGFSFSTYAVPVVMGEVRRLFRDGGLIKVSRSVKELYLKINNEKQKLEQKLCREPTVCEIAKSLGVSSEDVAEAICAAQPAMSLTYEDNSGVKEADLPTFSYEEEIYNRLDINAAAANLSEKEKQILKLRYFNSLTQNDTARAMNMSQVQISRMEKKILLKLREKLS